MLVAGMTGGDHFGDRGVERKITLKWILEKYCVMAWTGRNCLRLEFVEGLYR
jgi:hypothetical protein